MKPSMIWTVCCSAFAAITALSGHAEPAHRAVVNKGVDLDAAARATAALYSAAPTPAQTPAPTQVTAPIKTSPVQGLSHPVARSSPLLPAPAVPVDVGQVLPPPQAASEVWAGAYRCDHAEKVSLRPGAAADQVELHWKAQRWQMRRMDSRSGAMRLEDATARMVWIQLPNKSMLLDQRQGRRLLDECQHDVQVQTAAQMKTNPPPALFDTTGMGR